MSGDAASNQKTLQDMYADITKADITEELAMELLSDLNIVQNAVLQQLQSARARRNAAGGYNGGWAVEAATDRTGAIRAP